MKPRIPNTKPSITDLAVRDAGANGGKPIRLTPDQVQTVLRIVAKHAGDSAATYLFGSRLDDQARGGDLDLIVETAAPMPLLERARLQLDLEDQLGLPVDLIVQGPDAPVSSFQQLARARAQPLRLPT